MHSDKKSKVKQFKEMLIEFGMLQPKFPKRPHLFKLPSNSLGIKEFVEIYFEDEEFTYYFLSSPYSGTVNRELLFSCYTPEEMLKLFIEDLNRLKKKEIQKWMY